MNHISVVENIVYMNLSCCQTGYCGHSERVEHKRSDNRSDSQVRIGYKRTDDVRE